MTTYIKRPANICLRSGELRTVLKLCVKKARKSVNSFTLLFKKKKVHQEIVNRFGFLWFLLPGREIESSTRCRCSMLIVLVLAHVHHPVKTIVKVSKTRFIRILFSQVICFGTFFCIIEEYGKMLFCIKRSCASDRFKFLHNRKLYLKMN